MVLRLAQRKLILTIAGFDPSSGAGVTADLKTIAAHELYGTACITALTVQTTQGVLKSEAVSAGIVQETLDALFDALPPAAIKIGMLGSGAVASAVADFLRRNRPPNVVLDPVLRSSSGADLLDKEGAAVLRNELLALVDVVTPNLEEASFLSGMPVTDVSSMEEGCRRMIGLGARNLVVTGGDLDEPVDVLAESSPSKSVSFRRFPGQKIITPNTHGTGCAFSTALACELAVGKTLGDAVAAAKEYVAGALRMSYSLGKGTSPINHFFAAER